MGAPFHHPEKSNDIRLILVYKGYIDFIVRCCPVLFCSIPQVWGYFLGVSLKHGFRIPPTMPLTDLKIKNLKPKDKAYKVADFDGLFVQVTAQGSKLFRFKYRMDGC